MQNVTNQILSERINFDENKIDLTNKSDLKFKQKIELRNCSFSFNDEKKILKNLSLKFETGKIYGIRGVSGSGKTTLLRSINGLEKIESGKIFFEEEEINDFSLPVNSLSFDSMTKILSKFPETNLEDDKLDP